VTFGLPDELLGERAVSCVVLDGTREVTVDGILEHCRERLAPERVPNDVHVLPELPRGPAGKVVLPEVQRIVRTLAATAAAAETAEDGLDAQVFRTAAATFHVRPDSLTGDSSSETTKGWTSLAHVEFIIALESRFKVRLGPRDVMRIQTLGDAVQVIRKKHERSRSR
jgi:long-chain acyl-CoA synthetase